MNSDLRNKILITLGLILFYRILSYIPVPGIDISILNELIKDSATISMANMFNGNSISRFSIISLGIMPFITASIIMELMSSSSEKIKILKKTQEGMYKYMQYIRYLTIFITIIQSISITFMIKNTSNAILIDFSLFLFMTTMALTTGTLILMYIGEKITQHGIGNGISLIIFASIISGLPRAIIGSINLFNDGAINLPVVLLALLLVVSTIVFIIFIELAERRIPLTYQRGKINSPTNFLPIKINIAGVIPPIFASAVLILPQNVLAHSGIPFLMSIADFLSPGSLYYNLTLFFLVIFFAYFYTSITFNAKDISENLNNEGAFVNGVRALEETTDYLNKRVDNLTFVGSIYLGIISIIPFLIIQKLGLPFYFGGPMVLIIVQVALDTMKKVEANMIALRYNKQNNLETL